MSNSSEEQYLMSALNALNRKILVISSDFEILAARGYGLNEQKEEILGQACYRVFYGLSDPCTMCPAKECKQTLKPVFRHNEPLVRDCEHIRCIYAYPIFSEDSPYCLESMGVLDFEYAPLGNLAVELTRSNSMLRNLILSSPDPVIAADKTGRLLIFNHAASEISGYRVEEALNSLNIRDIYPEDGAREVMRKLRDEAHGGKGKLQSYQVNVKRKDGEVIPISLNAAIVYENEREVATIGFFHDMREKLHMQKDLENAQIQLLQSEKMASLGKLAAGVAHQLNNPLGGITLYSKLILEENELPEQVCQDLNRVLKDAERCRDTVKELLEFTRQTRHLMQPHDINQALTRTLFLLQNQPLFHNIKLETTFAPDLAPVLADIQQLNHLFMNIILNAAQAMEGAGTLSVGTYRYPAGKNIYIEIADTGPGIPEQVLPKIFEPFFTTKEEGKGTGLGLSLAYGIVQNHGGKIAARNRPEGGASFVIELPFSKEKTEK